jgi:ADP-ribose pyrophosphatase
MGDERLLETVVERRDIYTGRYLTFHVDTIRTADGHSHRRELVDHPGAVAILATADGELLMVRQYRSATGRILLEIPAGTLDRGADGTLEDPGAAAARELREETGHTAGALRHLGRFFTAPGFATEEMHLFLATELVPDPSYAGPEPDERIELQRIPWREAVALAERGEILDAKSILGLFWLDRLVARGEVVP